MDTQNQLLSLEFLKSSGSESFRAAWRDALKIAIEYKVQKLFLNAQKMMIYPDEFNWFLKDFLARALPLIHPSMVIAIVVPENPFGDFSIKQALRQHLPNGTLKMSRFQEANSAKTWLLEADIGVEENYQNLAENPEDVLIEQIKNRLTH